MRSLGNIKASKTGEMVLSFTDVGKSCPSCKFSKSQICLSKLFAKINLLQKSLNLQYLFRFFAKYDCSVLKHFVKNRTVMYIKVNCQQIVISKDFCTNQYYRQNQSLSEVGYLRPLGRKLLYNCIVNGNCMCVITL